jgi:putative Holliday junction resolvase
MPLASRHLGLDYGPVRIGVAVSDLDGSIVSPLKTIPGTGSIVGDVKVILTCSREQDPAEIIVGLPLNMDGSDSDQTKLTREFIAALTAATDLPVHVVDERLSTFAAAELMDEAGIPRNQRKQYRDQYAAVVILRTYFSGGG